MADNRLDIDEREEFPFASGLISIIVGMVIGGASFIATVTLSNWSFHLRSFPEPQIIWVVIGIIISLGTPILFGVIVAFVCISKTRYGSDIEEAKRFMDKARGKRKGRWLASVSRERVARCYRVSLYSLLISGIALHIGYYSRTSWILFPSVIVWLLGWCFVSLLEDEHKIHWARDLLGSDNWKPAP